MERAMLNDSQDFAAETDDASEAGGTQGTEREPQGTDSAGAAADGDGDTRAEADAETGDDGASGGTDGPDGWRERLAGLTETEQHTTLLDWVSSLVTA
ncbi:hypothetical protein ACFXPJ_14020, partial [Streptomyces goshikiensis]